MALPPWLNKPPDLISRILQQAAVDEEGDRLRENAEAWQRWRYGPPSPLKIEEGQPDHNVRVPYTQLLVNKSRSYLFGKGELQFEIEETSNQETGNQAQRGLDKEGAGQTAADKYLENVWKHNRMKTTLLKYATNGGVFGHAFMKIIPDDPFPRLVVLDPLTVEPHWDDQDIEKAIAYEIRYNTFNEEGDPVIRREVIYQEETDEEPEGEASVPPVGETKTANKEPASNGRPKGAPDPPEAPVMMALPKAPTSRWIIVVQEAQPDEDEWKTIDGPHDWPYSWPPIIDNQNLPVPNEYWGIKDMEEVIQGLEMSISRQLSNMAKTVWHFAHPFPWTAGLTVDQAANLVLELNPGDILNLPSPDAKLNILEMQSDLSSSIELYLKLKEMFHEVTRMPEIATGKVENAGPLSGVALEILYGPLVEATEDKRCTYGDMLIELNRRLLELGGFGPDMWVNIVWPDTIPKDPAAEGTVLLQDKQIGASNETLLEKRGYDPELEREQRNREAEENMERNAQLGIATNPETKSQQDRDQQGVVPPSGQSADQRQAPPRRR